MFGDKEVTLSFEVISNPKVLLSDLEVLMQNAASIEEYRGLLAAKNLISKAIRTEYVKQVISAILLQREATPGHIMNWTVDAMKKDLQAQAFNNFLVTTTVVDKMD